MRQMMNDLADWLFKLMQPEPAWRVADRMRFRHALHYWVASGAITYTRGKK